jgi:3-oxoacyl-[acyl-carrier protein] reductase
MDEYWAEKVALVTGGSRGIGRSIALALGATGAHVVLTYCSNRQLAEVVQGEIATAGGTATVMQLDLREAGNIASVYGEVMDHRNRLDIVVNNAGAAFRGLVVDTELDDWDAMFAINARGTFLSCREAARVIQSGGRIINITSGALIPAPPGSAAYAGSKAAVHQLTKALARELAGRAVTVNSVAAGPTDTDLLAQFAGARGSASDATPLQGIAEPADIAGAVMFLAGPSARWVTGQAIHVNGGMVIA